MNLGTSPYQIGGSLRLDASTYVVREADHLLYQSMRAGELCYVFNARQMGKSSLRVRLQQKLEALGATCAYIDMTRIGSEQVTPGEWYRGIMVELVRGFQLFGRIDLQAWWEIHGNLPILQQLSLFLEDVLLRLLPDRDLYILVDEIDSALSLPFGVDDFFALIRAGYNQRDNIPSFRRLNWALFGVTTPTDLIQDHSRTPFNIGRAIELQGFHIQEAEPLLAGLRPYYPQPKGVLQEILHWTNGQPFLTQKLCQLMIQAHQTHRRSSYSAGPTVEQVVQGQLLDRWETRDQPEHLRTIRNRLLYQESLTVGLLGLYQQILAGEEIALAASPEQAELLLSGLVIGDDRGILRVKNPIYRLVFHADWVAQQLEQLRPYAVKLKAWQREPTTVHLLTGEELKAALTWSKPKRLSQLDYRFLNASQAKERKTVSQALILEKTEREKADFALELFQTASQRLGQARQMAQQIAKRSLVPVRYALWVAGGVSLATLLLRATGWLQPIEWLMGDRFFQWRPLPPVSDRITIVEIDDTDLKALGRYPISDHTLAQTINLLQQYQPRQIGIDLYRDLPIHTGRQKLGEALRSDNIIGIEKAVAPTIGPPPELDTLRQVGFVDQILDGDGKVRRALLSIRSTQQQPSRYSFALRLALDDLRQDGIIPETLGPGMQLGKAQITPFSGYDANYIQAETGGYQILLNFYGTKERFPTISLRHLLINQFDPALVRDRIVLIGYTADSVNDLFQTPYGSLQRVGQYMPGVVLHANIIEQLVGGAKGEQAMLRSWPEPGEWLWISLWTGLGTAIAWRLGARSLWLNGAVVAVAGLALVGLGYGLFCWGWVVPVVPGAMGLIGGAMLLPLLGQKLWEQQSLQQLLRLLTEGAEGDLAEDPVGLLAIELLKQSEDPEQQALIDAWVQQSTIARGD
ncbi:MAG: CHASE2 domain-containing protein [Alkalinema sp. RU_4_3]|nr:CHASE2 domain-containing protein [Alkalinema sp. RU_4_3]